jgi:diguanylate cyclase (GGDEF)-like protein/PAS domain S-box-containing protein
MNKKQALPPPRWTVQALLGWLLMACLVPGLISTAFLVVHEYRDGQARQERDTLLTARALVQAVDAHLLKAQTAALALSTAGSLTKENWADFHKRAQGLIATALPGSNAVLSDASGQQLVNTLKPYGEPLPKHGNPAVLQQVFATGKPVISDLFIGGLTQRPIMSIDVPVQIHGRTRYVLSIGIEPRSFNGILQTQRLPESWIAAIFDNEGAIVSRTKNAEQYVGQKGAANYIRRFKEAPEGATESTTKEGIPVYSVFSRSPTTGWTVGIGIPHEALVASLRNNLMMLALVALVIMGLGILPAWLIGRRITRSIRALRAQASALGTGESISHPRMYIREAEEVLADMEEARDVLEQRTQRLQATYLALHESEQELLEAHRLGQFGTWQWHALTGDVRVSPEVQRIYGREVPSFPEQRGTLLTEEAWERVNTATQEALQTGIGYDLELQALHASGAPLWIHAKCEVVRDKNGQAIALRGTVQDITQQKHAEKALLDSEKRFRATFDQAAVGMAHVSLEGQWINVNDKVCEIVGYPRETLLALTFQDITYPPDLDADMSLLQQLLAGSIPSYSIEKRYIQRSGKLTWVNLTVALVHTFDGSADYFVSVIEDIQSRKDTEAALDASRQQYQQQLEQQVADRTEALQAANRELEQIAHRDVLTQLPNRLAANERLRFEFLRLKRQGTPYCVLMMDIDHFKKVNDTYGHETGDHVLQRFAATLSGTLRATDFVARYGGEEFLALLPDTDVAGAKVIAEKICSSVCTQAFPVVGQVTVSIGVGLAQPEDPSDDDAIRRADAALYRSKNAGRNTVQT